MKENKLNNYEITTINGKPNFTINFGEGYAPIITNFHTPTSEGNEALLLRLDSYTGDDLKTGDPVTADHSDESKLFNPNMALLFHGQEGIKSMRVLANNLMGYANAWENELEGKRQESVLETNAALAKSGARIVSIRFEGKRKKYYFKTTIPNLKAGNDVVVETVNGLVNAKFVSYEDTENFYHFTPSKWVVCRRGMISEDLKNYKIDTNENKVTPTEQRAFK